MIMKNTFEIEQFIFSNTAARKGIDNKPEPAHEVAMRNLFNDVLLPLKTRLSTKYAKTIELQINSGYRSKKLNDAVGGSNNSQHSKGEAVDTICLGVSLPQFYADIKELVQKNILELDQCIYEFDSWIHISYRKGANRKQFLKAIKDDGKTVYVSI